MAMRFRMNLWLAAGLMLSSALLAVADGKPNAHQPVSSLQSLKALLAIPERQVDYEQAKIAIDRFIDPSIDPKGVEKQLDAMTASIKTRTPAGAA